jgi:hypothetical protein
MPDNPFSGAYNAALDPHGGPLGLIGGLIGSPTAGQAQGGATADALKELSALKESGLNNQQAMLKFFQSPAGHDYFSNAGPDGMKRLSDGLAQTTQPSPTMNNIAPGGMLTATDQYGNTKTAASNPQQFPNQVLGPQDQLVSGSGQTLAKNDAEKDTDTNEIKNYNFFSKLGNIPKEQLDRVAGLSKDPTDAQLKNQSIDQMVKLGQISQSEGDEWKSGRYSVQALPTQFGQPTGLTIVIDNATHKTTLVRPSSIQGPPNDLSKEAPSGTLPNNGAAVGVLPAAPQPAPSTTVGPDGQPVPQSRTDVGGRAGFATKESMALGQGPIARTLGQASNLAEGISPNFIIDDGAKANDRMTALNTLRSNLQSLGTIGGGNFGNASRIEGYVHNFLDEGFWTGSAYSQNQKLIRLHETAQQNIADENARIQSQDPSVSPEVKKQASEMVAGWERVIRSMPTYDQLLQNDANLRAGTAGAPTVEGAGKLLINSAGKLATKVQGEVGEVAKDVNIPQLGGGTKIEEPDFDLSKASPLQLQSVDPTKLSPANLIKMKQRLIQLKAARNAPRRP